MAAERVRRRLAAILAADVVGYSRMVEADESGTVARLKSLQDELIMPMIARDGGRVVKVMGDGVLVEYGSAVDAVRNAIEIQAEMAKRNEDLAEERRIAFRVGINVGDVIIDGEDIHGDGVNVAARLEGICEPGGVYVSGTVHDHVEGKLATEFDDLGEHTVKNITRPVRVYRVRMAGDESPRPAARNAEPPMPERPSIAVLAFNNMSGDAEQEYFSDGISEDVITDLSKLDNVHVIARNSSFVFKQTAVSIPEVARDLGVRYVLEGSVRKAGNRVRVTAQLIDSTTGGHVWADRYDRDLTDIFAVQDELTHEIVSALKLTLSPEEEDRLAHKGTADVEAYNLILRGREQASLHTRTGNIGARDLFARAITIDPDYAAAYALTAFTHVIDYVNGWAEVPEQSLSTGLKIAQRAAEMDATEPHAGFALGIAYLWSRDVDRAQAEAERCLALEPNSSEGHLLMAHIQIFGGRAAAAIETLDAYIRLDPHYPDLVLQFLAEALISLGRYDDAIAALKQRLERSPGAESAYALLVVCYGHLDRIEEGREAFAELMRINPDFSIERRRRVLPFKNPADFEHRVEGMRKVGLTE